MALNEQSPRTQPERKQTPDVAAIASHVAGVVDNLQRDSLAINNPHELCLRADMAMVAMLEMVSPVLPEIIKEQVQSLISIHDALYQAVKPSAQQQVPEHEH